VKSLLYCFVTALLVACGGGDGTSSDDSSSYSSIYSRQTYRIEDITVLRDVPYSVRYNDGVQVTLVQDIVLPPSSGTLRPLLIWIHGGGMMAGDKKDLLDLAVGYAQAGYVTASINYRLTPRLASDPTLKTRANLQAVEDLMSAIRFMRQNATQYGIDVNKVATIGYSAGGELSLINAVGVQDGLVQPDYAGQSERVQAAVSTGYTLVNSLWDSDSVLKYQNISPVLLFHAKSDYVTLSTWDSNVVPTQERIVRAGGSCLLSEQPSLTHTADFSFGSSESKILNNFLATQLRL